MKNIVIGIHGIRTEKKSNWINDLSIHMRLDHRFAEWGFIDASYGYFEWIWTIVPFFKRFRIKRFLSKLRKIQKKNPGVSINIIGHSYGTMIAYEAIKRSGKDGKYPVKVDSLVLVASIVSAHEDFKETIGNYIIRNIYNYCSYADEVARYNPFGHSGYWGFIPPKPREHINNPYPGVYNRRYDVEHSEWFDEDPPDFYTMWLDDIIEGQKNV